MNRPTGRDWILGLLLGAAVGALVLGVGGRIAMRGIALLSGGPPSFSLGGSLRVVLFGAIAGLAAGLILVGLHALLPRRPVVRGALFWLLLVLVTLRGLKPLDVQRVVLFMPLVLISGAVLRAAWCRLTWKAPAAAPPTLVPTG